MAAACDFDPDHHVVMAEARPELAHGIHASPGKGKGVTHVSGTICHLSLGPLTDANLTFLAFDRGSHSNTTRSSRPSPKAPAWSATTWSSMILSLSGLVPVVSTFQDGGDELGSVIGWVVLGLRLQPICHT